MKRTLIVLTLFALTGCKWLGIGQQCYTCTTTYRTPNSSGTLPTTEVCQEKNGPMQPGTYENQQSAKGLHTLCVEKR